MATPKHLVTPPPAVPYRYGLFSVATLRTEDLTTNGHWRNGIVWDSQNCGSLGFTQSACLDENPESLDPTDCGTIREFDPFTVYEYSTPEIPGYSLAEHRQHAADRLLVKEQSAVEFALWDLFGAEIFSGEGGCQDLTEYPGWYALGAAEQVAAGLINGGVIHMSRVAAMALGLYLFPDGQVLRTRLGTPVIAGAGYGFYDLPGQASIVVTGQVAMYRGEIEFADAVDKANNKTSIIAARDYVVGWDCGAVCITASICTPTECPPLEVG